MFDEHGNLKAGFADWTVAEVEERLVSAFPDSHSRPRIIQGYKRLRAEMQPFGMDGEHWIDGSFSTAKAEPGDLDLLTVIDKDAVDALDTNQKAALVLLVNAKATKATHDCDSYFLPRVPDTHPLYANFHHWRTYWMGEFGFDRDDHPKGIVRVSVLDPPPTNDNQSEENL
jgi:hypothetical protein